MTYQSTLPVRTMSRTLPASAAESNQKIETTILSCLDNIRRDLLRCVEDGNYAITDGERSVECASVVPCDYYDVAVELITSPLVPEPTWQTTFEINPSRHKDVAELFSKLTAKAAQEGISILKFVAVYSDSCTPTVYGIPVTLHRKTNPGNWQLAVQYRVIID